jgi:tetratricopeptide (TPR) repeat protein
LIGQPATTGETAAAKFRLGIEFLKVHNYESALEAFRASARIDPNVPQTHGNIGFSLLSLKRPEEAVTAFREAIKLAPTDGSFRTALCQALVATGKNDEAIRACQEGVRLVPDSAEAHAALIRSIDAADRVDANLEQFINGALIRFRDNEAVLASRGRVLLFATKPATRSRSLGTAHKNPAELRVLSRTFCRSLRRG